MVVLYQCLNLNSVLTCCFLANIYFNMFYNSFFSVLHAKALYYQETLCRKEDIQKFLSSLVRKCRDLKRYFIFFFLR